MTGLSIGRCNHDWLGSELTLAMLRRITTPVLKLLRHLLCLGILLGLAGNGVAVAAPCILMSQSSAMAGMPDCKMPAGCAHCGSKSSDSRKTDKAPGCMAMAGCAAVIGMKAPVAATTIAHRTVTADFWPTAAVLAGRDVAPEPEPPTLLG